MVCPKCGKQVQAGDSNFCPVCGQRLSEKRQKVYYVSEKSKTTAVILALIGFLGIAGLHRFYVGKVVSGALYLATGGLFGIGTIYDIIKLLCECFEDADGFPLYSDSSMKSNYRRRKLKKTHGILSYVAAICIGFIGIVCLALLRIIVSLPNNSNVESEQVQQQASKDFVSEDELKMVNDVKDKYQNNKYVDAEVALELLKQKYPESKYIETLGKDYPDLADKAQSERDRNREILKSSLEEMHNELVDIYADSAYKGYEYDSNGLTIYVSGNWNYLSEDQRYYFIAGTGEVVKSTALGALARFPIIFFRKYTTKAKVGTWDPSRGARLAN